jgi:lipooligosaccharide transport system ATP-binding protein
MPKREYTVAVIASELRKRYGDLEAVRGVSFEVATGEVVGFLGPNGAGKTTTVRMLSCFLPPTSGTASICGLDVVERPREVKRLLGICPQADNLDPDFDVLKNLLVYGRYFGLPGGEVRSRAAELLEFVALSDKTHSGIDELSGGMKRRLVLARALLNNPRVLILDEPTTGLDPQARHAIWTRIRSLRAQGTTVLLTTHYMEEATRLCDRVAIMDHGRVIALGTPAELIESLGADQIIEFSVTQELAEDPLQNLPSVNHLHKRGEFYALTVSEIGVALPALLAEIKRQQSELVTLTTHQATLEDVFVSLTGRMLRDG